MCMPALHCHCPILFSPVPCGLWPVPDHVLACVTAPCVWPFSPVAVCVCAPQPASLPVRGCFYLSTLLSVLNRHLHTCFDSLWLRLEGLLALAPVLFTLTCTSDPLSHILPYFPPLCLSLTRCVRFSQQTEHGNVMAGVIEGVCVQTGAARGGPAGSQPEGAGDGLEGEAWQEQHHLPRRHVLCHVPSSV